MYPSSWKVFLALSAILALVAQLVSVSALETESNGGTLQRRQSHPILRARQAAKPDGKTDTSKGGKPNTPEKPEDVAAGQLISTILDWSSALDAVTFMGSNATIVKLGSEAAIKLLPELNAGREKLLKIVNKEGKDEATAKKIGPANDKLTKILKTISAKPEDSSIIKASYPELVQHFEVLFTAYDTALNLSLPGSGKTLESKKAALGSTPGDVIIGNEGKKPDAKTPKARTSRDQTISTQPLLQRAPGKRITLPVRVEPKLVDYHHHLVSDKQTFFSWLNFTVVLDGLAVGLLNFGDRVRQISAGLFTLVALITFHWRANAIRKRGSGNYDNRIGPKALCITLLIAMVTNFILPFTA
ncbi:hypothetical protein MJO28_004578 [Puccinia striiformis f. sp. tritici]|uniref:Uncharacterized protein n=1 Tax=Puccinia striiformis f. sp. tritici TaxID=168172 RepID=A0ACC0EP49_9BASI|nr:hypothetical protein MJO28_004578 [Puccinia striiformis f. sp. tritici]